MYYYKLLIIGSSLGELTYSSQEPIKLYTIVNVSLKNKIKRAIVVSKTSMPEFETLHVEEILDEYYENSQIETAKFISSYYCSDLAVTLASFTPHKKLKNKENNTLHPEGTSHVEDSIVLSNEQQNSYEFIRAKPLSLLFGDTGSGKTEIYIKLFFDAIRNSKRALFLVPEISLTPQMLKRVQEHFGESVVLWHSKLTVAQKRKALEKIYDGSAKIVAGARSALFLPIYDLGLIVVDEEHDESYKSSSNPRYNARDMAIYIGNRFDIKVVLGSATPSLSSYEKVPFTRLKGTYYNSQKEYTYEQKLDEISPLIIENLKINHESKKQSIVFVPTRANFKYIICQECGQSIECPYCSVGMSVHSYKNILRCHYCNYSEAIPKICSSCGGENLVHSRLGTVEAIDKIKESLKVLHVEQFDRDSITSNKKLVKILEDFNDNKIDVLVGTQMLSKGHNYHDVALCIIMGIDNVLHVSDYRARERALSMLLQIAGRSGRSGDAKVIVQSFNEEFFSKYVDDYEKFLKDEKLSRIGLYPPYKKLARLMFAHKNEKKAQEEMNQALFILKKIDDIEIVGFGQSPINKIASKFRYQILLRADRSTQLLKAVSLCRTPLMQVDIDPIDFS